MIKTRPQVFQTTVGLVATILMFTFVGWFAVMWLNGSCLPLRLFLLPNGTAIMNELRERHKDRLVHNYNYSAEEIRTLRRHDANELIR